MGYLNATVHVTKQDAILARQGESHQWVVIGDLAIFADDADLLRIRTAIDGVIAMRAPLQEVEGFVTAGAALKSAVEAASERREQAA